MNKIISLVFIFIGLSLPAWNTTYYVHPELGNDANSGTHLHTPLKSLAKASTLDFQPGDALLLAAGYTFKGTLKLEGKRGEKNNPITFGSYQWANSFEDPRAIIDASFSSHGIFLVDCSFIKVENLIIQADEAKGDSLLDMRCGVLVTTSQPGFYEGVVLKNLFVRNIFIEEEGFQRGKRRSSDSSR